MLYNKKNPYRDPVTGRYTSGPGLTRGGNRGKIRGRKKRPFRKQEARLTPAERQKITSEINTLYAAKYKCKKQFTHRSVYNDTYYRYYVRNGGYSRYTFLSKEEII